VNDFAKNYLLKCLPAVDSAMMEGVKKFFGVGKQKPKELSDPYMTFSFAGQTVSTKVLYETYSPEFNQELKLAFKVRPLDLMLCFFEN